LFKDVDNRMRIAREEIFGPVATVTPAKDYDEALELANDTPFGLSSGICTTSLKHASHFKRNSDAGMVMVNLPTAGVDYHVPFGGRKGSSYGPREQGVTRRSSTRPSRPCMRSISTSRTRLKRRSINRHWPLRLSGMLDEQHTGAP